MTIENNVQIPESDHKSIYSATTLQIPNTSRLTVSDQDFPRPSSTPPSPSHMRHHVSPQTNMALFHVKEWSVKKFSEFKTHSCTWLLEQVTDVNNFTSEDFEELGYLQLRNHQNLKKQRLMVTEDLKLYSLLCTLFDKSYEQAKTDVATFRKQFLEAFYPDTTPIYHRENGSIILNYDQLTFAQQLLKQSFPGFFALAKDEKNICQVAHITQLLILGDDLLSKHPSSAEVFEVREIGHQWGNRVPCVPLDVSSRSLLENNYHHLRVYPNITNECREAMNLLIEQFIDGNSSLTIGDEFLKEHTVSSFVQKFGRSVRDYILTVESKNPGTTKKELTTLRTTYNRTFGVTEEWKEIFENAFRYFHPNEIKELRNVNSALAAEHSIDEELLNTAIHAKFLEFLLFIKSDHSQIVHARLEDFYKDYLVRAKIGAEGKHAHFRCTSVNHQFDASLKPVSCTIHHQMYFSSETANMLGLCENFGSDVSIGKIVSTFEFGKNSDSIFYIQNKLPTESNAFTHCFWNWRTPERLIEYTLKEVCPEYLAKSIKQKLNQFISQLKKLDSIKLDDELTISQNLDITIYTPPPATWFSSFTYYMTTGSSDEETTTIVTESQTDELLASRLKMIIQEGMGIYEEHNRRQKLLKSTDQRPNLMTAYQIANLLDGVKKAFNAYISTQISKGYTNVRAEFQPLIQWLNHEVLPTLPSCSSKIEGFHQPVGLMTHIKNGIFESTNCHDIEWKVIRYQSMLRQLRFGITNIIAEEYNLKSIEDSIQHFLSLDPPKKSSQELHELIENLFNNVDLTITNTEQFTQYYLSCVRTAYAIDFILKLRSCHESLQNSSNIKAQKCIRKIANLLYTKIDLERECLALIQKFYDLGNILVEHDPTLALSHEKTDSYLLQRIDQIQHYFNVTGSNNLTPEIKRWLKSAKDHWNFGFDPNTEGNLPHKFGDILFQQGKKTRKIKSLAFGSSTVEGWVNYAHTNAEFQAWMECYRSEGKSHLFVINQDLRSGNLLERMIKRVKGGVETDRINAILGMTEEFDQTLFPIVLSKNSAFFRQSDEFEDLSNAKDFKKELIDQHFELDSSVSGNFIPPHILKIATNLQEQSKIWAGLIHTIMFYGKPQLSVEERQTFYDLFQDILVIYLMITLDVDSYNISCRDAIDRAADSNSRLWAHLGLVHNMEKEAMFRERYEIYLLSRAPMTRKRKIILERVDRNKQTVGFYEAHKKGLQRLHEAIFITVSITPINP
jgi:hypothetical protein